MTGVESAGGLFTFGETMGLISALDVGPLEAARGFRYGIGGAESNVAIGVARLGGSVTWFGRLGADATGTMIARRLRAENVEVLAVVDDQNPTGLMVKHHRFAHAAHLDYHRAGSAATALTPADLPAAAIQSAAILHVTGITPALSASAADTVFAAVELARDAGTAVSVDVNYRAKLWRPDVAAPVLRRLVTRSDIVFAGPEEARLVLGPEAPTSDIELALALSALGPRESIVKNGARGAVAVVGGDRYQRDALPVHAIDTVGAGDAFVAGYLAEHLRDAGPDIRLRTAIQVGALAVTVPGDCEGLPYRGDLAMVTSSDDVLR
jgi:2-dehydro-3-deoxygluconokinase